jgi:exonuclease SbcC
MESITQISVKLNSDKENKLRTEKLRKEYDDAKRYSTDWKRLCEVFGAAKGQKFRMIAQGYTLDIMLSYANMHLKQLSNRYQLVRTAPDSLALMIIDLDMLSERRTVNTLSGGETFLVSLALALALSSLSSNNMSIESLFVDEGFGSLDSDTLRVAMEALEHLQSQGRKIGVISHLSNMIERIPTQICVQKKRGGKSIVEIMQQF